jgi:hypothetical protein
VRDKYMDDYYCNICGADPKAVVRVYANEPFVDGRNYNLICWMCANVPKSWYYDENDEVVILEYFDRERIHTVKELMAEGWDRDEAERSTKAIKKLLKTPLIKFDSELGMHIFSHLVFGDEVEMELSV